MRRPDGKGFNGLVLLAQGAEAWSKTADFAKLPETAQKEILAACRWIRGMERVRGRREVARALMSEHPGLYVKPPAYNPEWFSRKGYHFTAPPEPPDKFDPPTLFGEEQF